MTLGDTRRAIPTGHDSAASFLRVRGARSMEIGWPLGSHTRPAARLPFGIRPPTETQLPTPTGTRIRHDELREGRCRDTTTTSGADRRETRKHPATRANSLPS